MEAKKLVTEHSSDIGLVNFLLRRALQEMPRRRSSEARSVAYLHCWSR